MNSTFETAQIKLMKDYINYDELINQLIDTKNKELLKSEIEILQLRERQERIKRDIKRIEQERDLSNLGNYIPYIFVNPINIYNDLTKSKI